MADKDIITKERSIHELYKTISEYRSFLTKDTPLEFILEEVKRAKKEGVYYHSPCCKYFVA